MSLRALSDVISDFRIFARLWGLLGIWAWGGAVLSNPPTDAVLRSIAVAQVAINALYQVLENGAYLASKGVLKWSKEKQNWAWILSSKCWAAHVALEGGRLGWLAWKERQRKSGDETMGMKEEDKQRWKRELGVTAAYAPLTIHWSIESGVLSDTWVGLLGSVAGWIRLKQVWVNSKVSE